MKNLTDLNIEQSLSVVIRNKNEQRYIGYAIQSVIDIFNKPEITIIDNNSSDNSIDIVNSFNFENIKVLNLNDYTPGKSINLGVKNCSSDNILILSAHSEIKNINYKKINSALSKYAAVFGKQIPILHGKKITPRYIWSHFSNISQENMFSEIENRYFIHNAFCFYRKSTLQKKPFNENLYGKEDRYWASDIIKSGKSYYYDHTSYCHHHYTERGATWKGIG